MHFSHQKLSILGKNRRTSIETSTMTFSANCTTIDQFEQMLKSSQKPKTLLEFNSDTEENVSIRRLYSEYELEMNRNSIRNEKCPFLQCRSNSLISPTYSHTSRDVDNNSRSNIQFQGRVTYQNLNEIPTIILATRRRPLPFCESYKDLSNNTSLQVSPVRQRKNQSKTLNIFNGDFEEEDEECYSIWDDEEGKYGPLVEESVEFLLDLQQFLILYKMRAGTYPKQRTHLENETVIKMAIHLTRTERRLFKKYFPSKQVLFEDETNYARIKQRKQIKQLTQVITPLYTYVQ